MCRSIAAMRCFLHLRGNPENLKRSVVSMINMVKLPTKKSNLFLRVAKGHAQEQVTFFGGKLYHIKK